MSRIPTSYPRKLIVCWYCGGEPEVLGEGGEYWVSCTDCEMDGPSAQDRTGAIDAWNLEAAEGIARFGGGKP